MIVSVSVDEADINSVKTGQTASVTVSAVSDESFEGKITEVSSSSSSSDSSSVKYAVEITVDKESGMLEGMSASCVINVEEADNAVLIPSAAIQESKGSTYVYTSKDSEGNLTGKTKVSTGLSNGTQVQITSGLSEGDTVYYTVAESASSSDSTSSKADSSGGMRGGSMPSGGSAPSGNPGGNGGSKS